jgi:hypothetical protein
MKLRSSTKRYVLHHSKSQIYSTGINHAKAITTDNLSTYNISTYNISAYNKPSAINKMSTTSTISTTTSAPISLPNIKDQYTSFLEDRLAQTEVKSKQLSKHGDLALQAVSRRQYEEIKELKRKLEESQATVKAQNDTICQLQEENERLENEKDLAVSSVMTTAVNLQNKVRMQGFELSAEKKKKEDLEKKFNNLVEENTKLNAQNDIGLGERDAKIEKLMAEMGKEENITLEIHPE